MNLYILRHAQAEDVGAAGDEARRLTARGRERAREAAVGMRAFGLKFDAILTSPLARAAETGEQVAAAYANEPSPLVVPELAAGVAAGDAANALAAFARYENVMVVGHEPQLSALVSLLLTGSPGGFHLRFRKGGCVALELSNRVERGGAELQWMMTQRQLRKLRK
ncbi:MAG: phosphohistidine phosphatase SixA [Candidatus Binataceae bacterium]